MCPKCGAEMLEEDNFCANCGIKIEKKELHCKKCGNKINFSEKFCGKCGNNNSEEVADKLTTKVKIKEPPAVALRGEEYFCISLTKFLLLTFSTFGLYIFYWCYKNAQVIKEQEEDTPPFWMAVLAPLSICAIFDRILESAKKQGYESRHSAGILYLSFISGVILLVSEGTSVMEYMQELMHFIFSVYEMNPAVFKIIGLALVIFPMYYIQRTIVFNNSKVNPDNYRKNYHLADTDILFIIIGGLLSISVFFD